MPSFDSLIAGINSLDGVAHTLLNVRVHISWKLVLFSLQGLFNF